MATKIKVTPQKEEMLEKERPETPLLDLSDAAVKDLIRSAKKRGYVTYDQINALLSSFFVSGAMHTSGRREKSARKYSGEFNPSIAIARTTSDC
jgi:hypothetical protein